MFVAITLGPFLCDLCQPNSLLAHRALLLHPQSSKTRRSSASIPQLSFSGWELFPRGHGGCRGWAWRWQGPPKPSH